MASQPTALIDWYIDAMKAGFQLAYAPVDYHSLRNGASVQCRIPIHHFARWLKRVILRIPTNRGSNCAVNRSAMLQLYDRGMLADETNVGPNIKAVGGRVAYSRIKKLVGLTSGRMFTDRWIKVLKDMQCRYSLQYTTRERVGVQKAATTWLFNCLEQQHPGIRFAGEGKQQGIEFLQPQLLVGLCMVHESHVGKGSKGLWRICGQGG